MTKKTMLADQLRKAITSSNDTMYRLAEESGVPRISITRFVNGERGLTLDSAGKLADVLGLQLTPKPTRASK